MRRYYPLALERPQVVFFPLSWTVVHPINSESPLFGLKPEDLARDEAEFLILLTGIDETFAQTVHARSSYRYSEIVWGAKFAGALEFDDDGSAISVNMERFHEVEPDNPEGVLLLPKH
jgi:inward rectifier potassium channel